MDEENNEREHEKCVRLRFPKIEKIGSGGFGITYKLPGSDKTPSRALKVIKNSKETRDNVKNEFLTGYVFSRLKIGPEIIIWGNLTCKDVKDENNNRSYYFIVMELFDNNGITYIENNNNSITNIVRYSEEFIKLMNKMYNRKENTIGYASFDIKPENTVVKGDPISNDFKVRLIDFDKIFCIDINNIDDYSLEIYKHLLIISFYVRICLIINYYSQNGNYNENFLSTFFKSFNNCFKSSIEWIKKQKNDDLLVGLIQNENLCRYLIYLYSGESEFINIIDIYLQIINVSEMLALRNPNNKFGTKNSNPFESFILNRHLPTKNIFEEIKQNSKKNSSNDNFNFDTISNMNNDQLRNYLKENLGSGFGKFRRTKSKFRRTKSKFRRTKSKFRRTKSKFRRSRKKSRSNK
jgi:serine/threonine protein kinase